MTKIGLVAVANFCRLAHGQHLPEALFPERYLQRGLGRFDHFGLVDNEADFVVHRVDDFGAYGLGDVLVEVTTNVISRIGDIYITILCCQ